MFHCSFRSTMWLACLFAACSNGTIETAIGRDEGESAGDANLWGDNAGGDDRDEGDSAGGDDRDGGDTVEPLRECHALAEGDSWLNVQLNDTDVSTPVSLTVAVDTQVAAFTVGLADSVATTWADLAATVRFDEDGAIQARDGGAYTSEKATPWQVDETYTVELDVDVVHHVYDAYVEAPSLGRVTLGTELAFRPGQASVATLGYWSVYVELGGALVCGPRSDESCVPNCVSVCGGEPDGCPGGSRCPFHDGVACESSGRCQGGTCVGGQTDLIEFLVKDDNPNRVSVSAAKLQHFPVAPYNGLDTIHAFSFWLLLPENFVDQMLKLPDAGRRWVNMWEMKLPGNNKWRNHVNILMHGNVPYFLYKGRVEAAHSPKGEAYDEFQRQSSVPVPLGHWTRFWTAMKFSGTDDDGYFKMAIGENAETTVIDFEGRVGHPKREDGQFGKIGWIKPLQLYSGIVAGQDVSLSFIYAGPYEVYDDLPRAMGGNGTPIATFDFGGTTYLDRGITNTGPVLRGIGAGGGDWEDLRNGTAHYNNSAFQLVSGPEPEWDDYVEVNLLRGAGPGGK